MAKIKNTFNDYIKKSGFPETVDLHSDIFIKTMQEYLDLVMYRDVVERHHIGNTFLLKFLMKYCFANFATLISFNKLYNDFRSQGLQLSKNTIYDYITHLEDAYAFFAIPPYALSVREQMRNPKKLYAIDVGFKQAVDVPLSTDIGRVYENIVFIELRRGSREIFYYKGKQEVDFFYIEKGERHLINVCYDLEAPSTREREIQGLLEAMNHFDLSDSLLITSEREEKLQQQKCNNRRVASTLLTK